jgi:hypothetical protein
MNVLELGIAECRFQFFGRAAIFAFRVPTMIGALLAGLLPLSSPAAGQTAHFEAHDVEIRVFPENSIKQIAVCKIDSVSTDYRKIGFFCVKLLPRLVVKGVRLEFNQADLGTNWLAGLQFDPAPGVRRSAVEWRDFTVFFPQEKLPRLRAERVYPPINAASTVYRLEGVTVQSGGEQFNVPRAELRAEGQSAQVMWTRSDWVIRWDLFTGQCKTNSIKGNINEKS